MSNTNAIPMTVIIRSYNDAKLLPRTLAALDQQRGVDCRYIVFESASVDDSLAILQAWGKAEIIEMEPGSYRSSVVLNTGAAMARTECVAYVNSDAILQADDVLRHMADTMLADERCAGACVAQDARADATPFTRLDHHLAFSADRSQLAEGQHWLSMVTSMIRRSVWERIPFDERVTYAEDAVWSHAIINAGWTTRFIADRSAEHSHNYTWSQRYRRAYGDSAALSVIREKHPARTVIGGVLKPLARRWLKDGWYFCKRGRLLSAALVPWYRLPQLHGAWKGARDGWEAFHSAQQQQTQPVHA